MYVHLFHSPGKGKRLHIFCRITNSFTVTEEAKWIWIKGVGMNARNKCVMRKMSKGKLRQMYVLRYLRWTCVLGYYVKYRLE